MFPVGRFPPPACVDVVVEHDASRPVRFPGSGTNVIQNENSRIPGEFDGSRNRKFHLLVAHGEYRDDRPFAFRGFLDSGDAIAVVASSRPKPTLLNRRPCSLECGVLQHGDELGLDVAITLGNCDARRGECRGNGVSTQKRDAIDLFMADFRRMLIEIVYGVMWTQIIDSLTCVRI